MQEEIIKLLNYEERTTFLTNNGDMKKGKKYVCSTCGAVSTAKGHLCTPVSAEKAYSCQYCGSLVSDPRHICKPKVDKIEHSCDLCGRVAAKKTELCRPTKI